MAWWIQEIEPDEVLREAHPLERFRGHWMLANRDIGHWDLTPAGRSLVHVVAELGARNTLALSDTVPTRHHETSQDQQAEAEDAQARN